MLVKHLREPLLLATRDGMIVAGNVAGADALGTTSAALDGTALAGFCSAPQLAALPTGESLFFPLQARNGRRFFCEATGLDGALVLLRLSGGPDPEQRLRDFNAALSRFDGIERADSANLDEVLLALLGHGIKSAGASAVGLFLLDATGTNLELRSSVGYPDGISDRFRMVPMAADIPLTDAVKRSVAVLLGTYEEFAASYPSFTLTHEKIALKGMACIPLVSRGRTIGVLGLGYPLPWLHSDADRVVLEALAQRCANAVERVRLSDAVENARTRAERSATQLARLHALTGVLAQTITWPQVVEAVVDMVMAATGARSGGLWVLAANGATVSLLRSVGPTGPTSDQFTDVPLNQPMRLPILDTIVSGTPSWIESCSQMEESYPAMAKLFAKAGGESALACLPLFAQGRCIGGLALNYDGVRRFDESERAFLQVMSWYSAQALERARLYAAEKSARAVAEANERRSEFLARAGTILSSSLDYPSTLASVATAAVPGVADWCIVEIDEDRRRGLPAVVAHVDPDKAEFVRDLSLRFRRHSDAAGMPAVIRTGKSELYPSISPSSLREYLNDAELADLYGRTGMTSAMVVPIAVRAQTLGAILLVSTRPERLYGDEDMAMAEELGRRAGVAVDNARLFRDAREADRLKDEFLAMLGHELRNPLTPILTALDLMELRGGEAFRRERSTITRQVRHVVRLVDDLLDVSRVTRGKIQLSRERVEVAQVVAAAVETASPLFEQQQQILKLEVPARGLPVLADIGRLSQAIANLLTNAAKYTEAGGTIVVSSAVENDQVCVRVRDSGIGIDPEILPTIFDLFVQAKKSIDRSQGGLGLGLTIVRSLVELHGGTVSGHSDGIGRGSEFVIRLPLGPAAAPLVVEEPFLVEPTEGRRWRVLVVDDNTEIAEGLAATLAALGCETRVAFDGPSAITAADAFDPELALLDIGLPVMDGYELARRFRRAESTSAMRLVAVSGYGQKSDRQQSRKAGFDEHIVKPVGFDTIRDILARLENATLLRR
jgi:signal transduction histidine kinase/ActR/RegA family two-component response regulator